MLLQQNMQVQDLLEGISHENFKGRIVAYSPSSVRDLLQCQKRPTTVS